MYKDLENPFSVTKAVEFSDNEIFTNWVNFNPEGGKSFESLLNPSEYLPKYVIGGKGCGKTHILRYFSIHSQLIKYENNVVELIENEKYIGIYTTFSILSSTKFKGKYLEEDQWLQIFKSFFQLHTLEIFLKDILEIITLGNIDIGSTTLSELNDYFSKHDDEIIFSELQDLIIYISKVKNDIDKELIEATFTRKFNYKNININPLTEELIFDVAAIFSKTVPLFTSVKFILIFDEFEKLFDWQKVYINTLVWEKRNPITFWIGARNYGYTTRKTLSGEEMKSGSEYQEISLDDITRTNLKLYKDFAKELLRNRLQQYYAARGLNNYAQDLFLEFKNKFSEYDEDHFINSLKLKTKDTDFQHFKDFRKDLKEISSKIEIDNFIEALKYKTENNPLLQKYKLFYFYKEWYVNRKKLDFQNILHLINLDFEEFLIGNKTYFDEIADKRKKDFIVQIGKENGFKNFEYLGFENFLELSNGNVRSFILMLKKAVENANIRGEKPFENGGIISLESQYFSVFKTAEWFYNDAEIYGDEAKKLYNSLKNLTDYLRLYRFCNKPTETSVMSFSFRCEDISQNVRESVDLLVKHSFILKSEKGRKEKSGIGIEEEKYLLNKILSPLWNLPISMRGTPMLTNDLMSAIFDFSKKSSFNKLYADKKVEINAPFAIKNNNLTIFD